MCKSVRFFGKDHTSKNIKIGDVCCTLEDQLMIQIIDRLPSAEARLAFTFAEICSQGGRKSYIKKYLPKHLKVDKKIIKKRKSRT